MEENTPNPLDMSDEEIMNSDWDFEESAETEETQEQYEDNEPTENDETISDDSVDDIAAESDDESGEPEPEQPDSDESSEAEDESEEVDTEEAPEEEVETDTTDYESEYKKLLAPFNANGKQMQVDSVEDAIQLMQMGANYNKKMVALKPNLKLLKMLENNGLLEEDKLSFLIDLDKKDPNAVKRLVKDSKLDLYNLESDDDKDEEYSPNTYTVDDKELELDAVLDEIKSTTTYNDTIDIISNKWDVASRQEVIKQPQILRVINEHKQNGIYDRINTVVEKERMLGRLSGLSDIEAYRQVGDRLHAEGQFGPTPTQQSNEPTTKPQAKKAIDPNVEKRKRAAAPTKSNPSASSTPSDFNPLALSDEDFEKQFAAKFL